MIDFSFWLPTRIVARRGCLNELGEHAGALGARAFIVCGESAMREGHARRAQNALASAGVPAVIHQKEAGEPTVEMTDGAAEALRKSKCDLVVSIGGGSAIDLAKAAAGLAKNPGSVKDYLEGVGAGHSPDKGALPHIAIPTTAGTGAEATKNAVISSPDEHFKKSFRSPALFPQIALLDAELTLSLPPEATAYSGMDAITQLIESILSKRSTPMTDALAFYALEKAIPAIETIMNDPGAVDAREDMLLASTLSGVCLANAGLGLAHGFAAGVGAATGAPHGKVCAILLPYALRYNRCACYPKMVEIARRIVRDESVPVNDVVDCAIETIEQMNKTFGIPATLEEWALKDDDLPDIARLSMGNSMSGNPSPVTEPIAVTLLKTMR